MSNSWIRVCATSELLPGEYRVAWDGDVAIAVFNIDGELYAVEDVCTHDGGELAGGPVDGYAIECVRHGARFDLRTGAVLCRRPTSRSRNSRSRSTPARCSRATIAGIEAGRSRRTPRTATSRCGLRLR